MTVVPLPDVPCLRIRTIFNAGEAGEGGNRFYFRYSGSAPTGANCTTIASDVASAWNTHMGPLFTNGWALKEVDVLDIATRTGLSGQWTGSDGGSRTGTNLPFQVATGVEFNIARRYRGGKPRIYIPPGNDSDLLTEVSWQASYLSDVNTGVAAFVAAIEALSVGSVGTLTHVNLSYYSGFTNITNSSGRERAVPTYRETALHDDITGYAAKTILSSQKRRRTSTTP